jgi:RNA polymerase sigma factor (sigma-70 family)
MAHAASGSVVRQIGSLFDGGSVTGLPDRQLLDRFVARRDAAGEAAFAALVARHGPMVLHICRQLLGDHQHAEDAFQAVFLVLARRARSVRDPDLLGHWLYGVALRTARKANTRLARQRQNERNETMGDAPTQAGRAPDQLMIAREDALALHAEIEGLPSVFRLPVVLCYFEGLSLDAAARRLRCPEGTLRSRLARARDKLRRGLTRRGAFLSGPAFAAVLDSASARAAVSSSLCEITTKAAINFTVGKVAGSFATGLAHEVLKSILAKKIIRAALAVLLVGAVATGAGFVGQVPAPEAARSQLQDRQAGKPEPSEVAANSNNAIAKPAPGRMFVVGRVLDPAGKPVTNATSMVYASSKALGISPSIDQLHPIPIGDACADGSGRFRIDAPRTSSSRYETVGAVAIAPGYGVGCVELDPDADQPAADITLQREQVIHGRLFDMQGRPAPDVVISVSGVGPVALPQHTTAALARAEGNVTFWWANANDFPAWPRPATTDAQGHFTVHGVGRNMHAYLTARHPRFALQEITVETDDAAESKPMMLALEPARIITGRVTYGDTGKPVVHAKVAVQAGGPKPRPLSFFETDADGRFRVNPPSGDRYHIAAWPPPGQPYLILSRALDWPKGALEQSLDVVIPRGVAVQGKVTEEGSGKPIAGAALSFVSRAGPRGNDGSSASAPGYTAGDGSFQLGALPGQGTLFVTGPSDDFVLQALGKPVFDTGRSAGLSTYSHANLALDLKTGVDRNDIHVKLRPGVTVTGQVVGPDDRPVRDAWIFSQIIMGPMGGAKVWHGGYHNNSARDGHFEVHGLAPDALVAVHFLEPRRKLGATAVLSRNRAAAGPVKIRLEPCAAARARIVNPGGEPFVGSLPLRTLTMAVNTGPPVSAGIGETGSLVVSQNGDLDGVDPINYEKPVAADADGRVVLRVLIPGATYRFTDRAANQGPFVRRLLREFTVKPGETLDLGDIVIEKPRP